MPAYSFWLRRDYGEAQARIAHDLLATHFEGGFSIADRDVSLVQAHGQLDQSPL